MYLQITTTETINKIELDVHICVLITLSVPLFIK